MSRSVPPPDYFDTSPGRFPWTADKCRSLISRRAQLQGGTLFIDDIFKNAGIEAEELYPPQTPNAFQLLLQAIHDSSFDSTKKNSLIYYLLRMWKDGRQIAWAQNKSLPTQYAMVMDGYWAMDEGEIEMALPFLTEPRVQIEKEFTSKALHAIQHSIPIDNNDPSRRSRLVLRYVRAGKLAPESHADLQIYVSALCENGLMDAWMYQRTFPEDAQDVETTRASGTRAKILRLIFDWSLTPRGRQVALKDLLAFPMSPYEHSRLTSYALHPPANLSETSLALLQELIHVRLIHQGSFTEAERLDRQFSHRSVSGLVRTGLETRRGTMKELLGALPEIQRKLIDLELTKEQPFRESSPSPIREKPSSRVNGFNGTTTPIRSAGVSPSTAGGMGGAEDLSNSWEDVQRARSTTSSYSFISQPNRSGGAVAQSPRSTPVSASNAFRRPASNISPQKAVLNAFAASSSKASIEGAPLSASRSSSGLTVPPKTPLGGLKRSGPSVPFGIGSPIGRTAYAPKVNSVRSGLATSTTASQITGNASFLSSSSFSMVQSQPSFSMQQQTPRASLFSQPVDQAQQRQRVLPMKRSFGQVSDPQKPDMDVDTRWDPAHHHEAGDMSVSELQAQKEGARNYESGESDDDIVLNNARMRSDVVESLIPPSPPKVVNDTAAVSSSSGRSDLKRRKVAVDEDLSDEDLLPGAYHVGEKTTNKSRGAPVRRDGDDGDDDTEDESPRKRKGPPSKITSRSAHGAATRTQHETQTPSPPPQSSKRTAKASSTSRRTTKSSTAKEQPDEDSTIQPRRSSRLSAAPSSAPAPLVTVKGTKKGPRASASAEPISPGQGGKAKSKKGRTKRQPAATIEEEDD
ncbi:hypothetical protein FRB95_014482 [Tulasnella sp. JGI-2019a]|nr:hypothetical protein FRB95_014482 [Tulasnella sp. JGI-2019a]